MGPLSSVPTEVIAWVARTVLGVTFLVSGAAKLRDVPAFTLAVNDYRILPSRLVGPMAHVLPLAELGVAVVLLSGWYMRHAAFISILLLLVFVLEDTVDGIGHRLSSDSILPLDERSGDDG